MDPGAAVDSIGVWSSVLGTVRPLLTFWLPAFDKIVLKWSNLDFACDRYVLNFLNIGQLCKTIVLVQETIQLL